jgi:hypothetical protein
MWCIVDEFSRVRPAVRITRELKAGDVIEALCEQAVSPDIRAHIRSAEAAIQANHNQRIARSAPAIATSVSRLADMVGSFGQRPVAGRTRRAHPRTKFVVLEGAAREPHISRCRVGEIPCERRMSEEIGLRRRQPLRVIFSGISQRLTKSPLMADFCGRRTSLKMARAGLSRGIQRKRKYTKSGTESGECRSSRLRDRERQVSPSIIQGQEHRRRWAKNLLESTIGMLMATATPDFSLPAAFPSRACDS